MDTMEKLIRAMDCMRESIAETEYKKAVKAISNLWAMNYSLFYLNEDGIVVEITNTRQLILRNDDDENRE